MFKGKQSIVILSILLFSCGHENNVKNTPIEISDVISVTDSLLLIVDEEFEIISQNGKKNNEELHDLENTIGKYQNIIQSDKKRESLLNETIINLMGICKDKDSLNNTLKITIDDLLYETEVIRDSIKTYEILNSKLKVESEEHRSTMEDSISSLNDKIIRLKSFIVDNVRPSKQKGLID